MKLRELIEALQKAPPEAMEQDVLMHWPPGSGTGCKGLHVVECLRFRSIDGPIGPFTTVLCSLDLGEKLKPEDDRRIYLSDVRRWLQAKKE